mmetsp:Transcript_14407/g.43574  ORF Transcript_14407/g.43574 Transcript_14407/m.43574 type:complete len:236 (+) Transcript_14407:530-1237(+)
MVVHEGTEGMLQSLPFTQTLLWVKSYRDLHLARVGAPCHSGAVVVVQPLLQRSGDAPRAHVDAAQGHDHGGLLVQHFQVPPQRPLHRDPPVGCPRTDVGGGGVKPQVVLGDPGVGVVPRQLVAALLLEAGHDEDGTGGGDVVQLLLQPRFGAPEIRVLFDGIEVLGHFFPVSYQAIAGQIPRHQRHPDAVPSRFLQKSPRQHPDALSVFGFREDQQILGEMHAGRLQAVPCISDR